MTYAMEAIGWTLIHFCWQAAAIALLYRLADAVLSRSRSNVRYVAALAALLAMFATASATLVYEAASVSHDRAVFASSQHREQGSVISNYAALNVPNPAATNTPDPAVPILAAFHDAVQTKLRGAMPWLDAIWLFGVLCLSVRTIGGWWLIQRLRRSSLAAAPAHVRASFERLAKRIGIEKHVELKIAERISGPLAMGVLKSMVLLPASALTALSPEQLEVVLAHELAHIRRADYLWNMLQTMIETLFFFHPAVWWVSGNLRRQRELCCDDVALECCADPLTYATALLRLEEERSSRLHLAMALDGNERGGLRLRIARILGEAPEGSRDVLPYSLVGACGMLAILLLAAPRLFADLYVDSTPRMLPASTVALPHESKIAGDPDADAPKPKQSAPAPAPKPTAKPAPAPKAASDVVVHSELVIDNSGTPQDLVISLNTPKAPAALITPAPLIKAPQMSATMTLAFAPKALISEVSEPKVKAKTKVVVNPSLAAMVLQETNSSQSGASSKGDYIDQMRAAGYTVDLDKYVAMKIQGVTPEYARSMATTGFGKPTADELIAMKIHGVDPSEVAELKSAGITPGSYQDLITYRIFNVTPEYAAGIKAAGFSNIGAKKLVELRIQGVTPEFAKSTKQQWPDATVDQMVQLRIFNINGAFIASAKRHGLEPLTIDKLVRLRISGILNDENPKAEK